MRPRLPMSCLAIFSLPRITAAKHSPILRAPPVVFRFGNIRGNERTKMIFPLFSQAGFHDMYFHLVVKSTILHYGINTCNQQCRGVVRDVRLHLYTE